MYQPERFRNKQIERLATMAPTATPAAQSTAARKGVQVHATIAPEKFEALEDHRWSVRLNMVDLVKLALDEYGQKHNLPGFTPEKTDAGKDAKPAA